ncbi:MAG: 4Fe-4S dicluster domain-containing protein [Candidatus Adiutrix sp.]|jgi:Fe-S oxidoreductase|nr:4Fe-4S dicluster domain-containing protein [Candidatus Adiutrix sp.]
MDKQTLQQFEALCVQEEAPACQTGCPLHVEARTLARLAAEGKTGEARKLLDRHLPLGGLIGYLCEGPCRDHCRRAELDTGLDLPLLERYILLHSSPARPMALPGGGKEVAVFGGGLASLTLAWDLGKKGQRVTVFHTGPAGGRLLSLPPAQLPEAVLPAVLEQLRQLKVAFTEVPAFSQNLLERAEADFQAVFLGFDDPALPPGSLGLAPGQLETDPVTLALTDRPKIFVCPLAVRENPRFIDETAAGKRATGSIDRVLQGVSPSAARDGEGPYPTRLFTNLADEPPRPPLPPADPWRPTEEECRAEAGRCIQCQCLECVKKCAFLRHYKAYPKKYARVMYNNILTAFGIRQNNTMINSCAECGLCGEICPQGADLGKFCALAKRDMVATSHMPVSAHEFALEDQAFSNSPEVAFHRAQPGAAQSARLFFPGCQLPASMPGQTAAVYQYLRENVAGGVGFFLACCGAPARWSGRPGFTGQTAVFLRETWERAGRPEIILACASCRLFFQAELPEIPTVSLWEVLSALPLPPGTMAAEPLALHDPCAARGDAATQAAVRAIIAAVGQPTEELPLSGAATRCCGYGGLAASTNPELGEMYARDRAGDTGLPLLAYCAMCRDRLRSVGKPALHLLDILFPGACPEAALARPAPGLSERQEIRRKFRNDLLKTVWGEAPPEDSVEIVMHITPEAARKMELRRILHRDVAGVILEAEAGGGGFVNPATGRVLASLRPRQVTFWVEYSRLDDGSFDIHDAYCHRMVAPGVAGVGADSPASLEGHDAKGGRR